MPMALVAAIKTDGVAGKSWGQSLIIDYFGLGS